LSPGTAFGTSERLPELKAMRFKKITFLIILILLQGLSLSLTSFAFHRVVFVYDGDTVLLKNGAKVRYLGINTPEIDYEGGKSEFMAHKAKRFQPETGKKARWSGLITIWRERTGTRESLAMFF